MSYTLIDYFKEFHSLKQKHNLSANAQACYFSILGEFNAARFPERLSISDRELKTLAGLKSVATAHDAKRILKNLNLIDFQSGRGAQGTTWYRLCTAHLPNINRTLTEHSPNIKRTLSEHSSRCNTSLSIDDREDVKTLDEKTTTTTTTTARARDTYVIDNIIEYWEESRFGRLDFELISELDLLVKKYGEEEVKAAMNAAKRANGKPQGVSFDFFKAVLENRLKPKKPKGAVSDENRIEEEDPRAKWQFSD